jgi:RNA polymerase sigma-70 factor (ECF subfamily)
MMPSQRSSYDRFATTRWSVVMRTAASASPDASTALTELVQRYWYPVYAYTRRCGHSPSIAQDVARTFLAILMRDFRDGAGLHATGQFRRFLLERLNEFLAGDWREAVDAQNEIELFAPTDLEARYLRDNIDANSPEQAYQRSFALELIARALKRLRAEATRSGHLEMYVVLEPYLAREPVAGEYEASATQLGTRPLALIVALKRLRQRLRELVGEELADTVTSKDELANEQAALHSILCAAQYTS